MSKSSIGESHSHCHCIVTTSHHHNISPAHHRTSTPAHQHQSAITVSVTITVTSLKHYRSNSHRQHDTPLPDASNYDAAGAAAAGGAAARCCDDRLLLVGVSGVSYRRCGCCHSLPVSFCYCYCSFAKNRFFLKSPRFSSTLLVHVASSGQNKWLRSLKCPNAGMTCVSLGIL